MIIGWDEEGNQTIWENIADTGREPNAIYSAIRTGYRATIHGKKYVIDSLFEEKDVEKSVIGELTDHAVIAFGEEKNLIWGKMSDLTEDPKIRQRVFSAIHSGARATIADDKIYHFDYLFQFDDITKKKKKEKKLVIKEKRLLPGLVTHRLS